jgi:predicted small lipoprotein YifL
MMATTKRLLGGLALATLLALAGCGGSATATLPLPAATVAATSTSAPTARSASATAAGAEATTVATAPRAASATPTRAATPGAGATVTRGGTARATASPGRLPTATDVEVKTVAIRLGQSAVMPEEGLTLDFAEVVNDSRCPRSANGITIACVWAGEATIVVSTTRGGVTSRLQLVIPGLTDNAAQLPDNPKNYTVFEGYKIQLASLEPQPTVDGQKPGEYTVTLLVSKVG